MSEWLPIRYGDFWDVPRLFAVEHDPVLLFNAPFSDLVDEYARTFSVHRLSTLPRREELSEARLGAYLGEIPVADVEFDETRRAAVHESALDPFRDYLDDPAISMWWSNRGRHQFHIQADLRFLTPEAGGRSTPVADGYRPNCWFGDPEAAERSYTDCAIHILAGKDAYNEGGLRWVRPGGAASVCLVPLASEAVEPQIRKGAEFQVCEGHRVVANGLVTGTVEPGG